MIFNYHKTACSISTIGSCKKGYDGVKAIVAPRISIEIIPPYTMGSLIGFGAYFPLGTSSPFTACYYTLSGGVVDIGGTNNYARSANEDLSVIVGYNPVSNYAWYWKAGVFYTILSGSLYIESVSDISQDGLTGLIQVWDSSSHTYARQAVVSLSGSCPLTYLPVLATGHQSYARSISADGLTIAGICYDALDVAHQVYWKKVSGTWILYVVPGVSSSSSNVFGEALVTRGGNIVHGRCWDNATSISEGGPPDYTPTGYIYNITTNSTYVLPIIDIDTVLNGQISPSNDGLSAYMQMLSSTPINGGLWRWTYSGGFTLVATDPSSGTGATAPYPIGGYSNDTATQIIGYDSVGGSDPLNFAFPYFAFYNITAGSLIPTGISAPFPTDVNLSFRFT